MNTLDMEDKITKKQHEYINILSSYVSSKYEDVKIIVDFLSVKGKNSLGELTKKEANTLIKKLQEIPAEYRFSCGKKKLLNKRDINSYKLYGELEACLNECDIDVYDCQYWANEGKEEHQLYIATAIGEIICGFYKPICESCKKYIVTNREVFEIVKNIPEFADKIVFGKGLLHHIDYEKDLTVFVCPSCHGKIHNDIKHPLYPKTRNDRCGKA